MPPNPNIVFLNLLTNQPASPADRTQRCIGVQNLQVGAVAKLTVKVRNIGNQDDPQVTVQFFTKRPSDLTPLPIPSGIGAPSNPLPPRPVPKLTDAEFVLNWTVQNADQTVAVVYAQIQTPSPMPHPEDMTQWYNAKKAVVVLPLNVLVAAPQP